MKKAPASRKSRKPFRIAVLASTRGTTLQALLDELRGRKLPGVKLVLVASDVEDCGALKRAKEAGVETAWIDPKEKTREEFDAALRERLKAASGGKGVDLICLMGFMRILSAGFVRRYRHRILNVHPALLPKYGGKGFLGDKVHEAVLASGDKTTGMTIHLWMKGAIRVPSFTKPRCRWSMAQTENPLIRWKPCAGKFKCSKKSGIRR